MLIPSSSARTDYGELAFVDCPPQSIHHLIAHAAYISEVVKQRQLLYQRHDPKLSH